MHGTDDWTLVADHYAATGRADVTLQTLAASAGVGLVQVGPDGAVTWSDETYRLHGRPRWRRVRSIEDALVGVGGTQARDLRSAYAGILGGAAHVTVAYEATPELGEPRPVVLRALGPGLALVHRAPATPDDLDPAEPVVVHLAGGADEAADSPAAGTAPEAENPSSSEGPEDATSGASQDSVHLASAVLAASPDLVVVYDLSAESVVQAAGSTPDADTVLTHLRAGNLVREHVHPDDRDRVLTWRRSLDSLAADDVASTEARFRVGEQWRWQEIRALEFGRVGDRHEVVLHIRDVHDRVEAVLRLTARERAFREVFDSSPVGLAVLDADGRFRAVNDAFCRLVGRTQDAVMATSIEALLHPEDRGGRTRSRPAGGLTSATELRLVRSDGAVMWVRMRSSDISTDEGERVLVSVEDVTSAKAHEDRLRHDSLHDDLTGLPNRRLIEDRLQRALARARRTSTRLAVYFIDLDDLKRVNDTHPWRHRAGDVLITSVADALRASLRDVDTLGRLGGDEFVAIVEDVTDDAMIDEIGERVLAAVREPLVIGEETVTPGASVGVATPESDDETPAQLLSRADSAMYRAKRAGGSRVVSADTLPPVAVDLGSALEEGRLRLVYRPVASLTTGTLLGVEALIRWGGEAAAPDEVREALEAGSALLPVVHWAVARAVADVRTVAPSRTDHLSVWLALPCRSALAASTRGAFETAFAGPWGDLDADSAPSIVVDVHEDELASVVRRGALHRHVEDLVGVGPVSLGVDRFSADAVPLGLMRSLAVASLTVDPHLLTRAEGDDVDRDLLRSLVAAAGALGVVTVADEVDSPADLELARSLGLHAVKGDLVGPFAPLETYSDLLHAGLVPLPDSFDRRTHDELTGDPLEGSITERAARPRPEETPPDPAAGEVLASAESGAELAESELLSQDVLAAIRWLDELDRTAQERLSGEGTDEPETGPVPEQPAQPRAEDPAPAEAGTADGPRTPRPSEPVPTDADGFVPALAPYEPAPPAARMPGLDLVDRPAEAPPRPALWSGSAPTLEPTLEPHAEPETVAEQPVPASATAAPATAPTTAGPVAEVPAATASDSDDIVIELRDAPEDIGAALAAELGVDLTPFDRQEVGALLDRPYGAADAVAQPPAAPSAAPPASPFAGMALPPSPFLVLRPKDPEA